MKVPFKLKRWELFFKLPFEDNKFSSIKERAMQRPKKLRLSYRDVDIEAKNMETARASTRLCFHKSWENYVKTRLKYVQ